MHAPAESFWLARADDLCIERELIGLKRVAQNKRRRVATNDKYGSRGARAKK